MCSHIISFVNNVGRVQPPLPDRELMLLHLLNNGTYDATEGFHHGPHCEENEKETETDAEVKGAECKIRAQGSQMQQTHTTSTDRKT